VTAYWHLRDFIIEALDIQPRPHRMTRSDSYLRIRYIEPGNGNINGDFEITVMELNREQFEQAKEKFSDQEVKGIPIYWCHIEGKIEFWPPYLVQGPAKSGGSQ
jgi:hypothetical protein